MLGSLVQRWLKSFINLLSNLAKQGGASHPQTGQAMAVLLSSQGKVESGRYHVSHELIKEG